MSTLKVVIFIAAAMVAVVVRAKPYPAPRTVELKEALNRTICPIQVEIDEDPERIPRKIKTMKCASQPNKYCQEQGIPRYECCAHSHHSHVLECVEIHDTVLVYYPASDHTRSHEVAVGCTCMIRSTTLTPELPNNSR